MHWLIVCVCVGLWARCERMQMEMVKVRSYTRFLGRDVIGGDEMTRLIDEAEPLRLPRDACMSIAVIGLTLLQLVARYEIWTQGLHAK